MDSRRLHLCAARDHSRLRRRAGLDAVITISSRGCLGQRLLGPDPVHPADVAHHHHRPRAGDIRADGEGDPRDRRLGKDASRRGGARHLLCAGDIVVQLGLQPRLQRGARARGGQAGCGCRLSRARGGEPAWDRQHLGAGPQWIRGAADGDAGRAAAADPRHRRRRRCRSRRPDSLPPHDLPLAERRIGAGRDRRRRVRDVPGDAAGRESEDRGDAWYRSRQE